MLVEVQHPDVVLQWLDRIDEGRDRTVALANELVRYAVGVDLHAKGIVLSLGGRALDRQQRELPGGKVLVREDLPHLITPDLAALGVGVLLDPPAELDLQPARQVEP